MPTAVPTKPVTLLEAGKAEQCRRSFSMFVREFWNCVPGVGKLVWNWHLDLLCDELQDVANRVFLGQPKKYDLVLNVCFGTSKSMIASVLFQAWCWTNQPEARFLSGTHTDSLALDLSTRCKDVVTSEKYRRFYPKVHVRSDRSAKEDWANTLGGERKCCTVGGVTPTGRHVSFIIIDDPLDPSTARSELELETAKRFMTEVVPSRMIDKMVTPIILVMQRLHPRDPTEVMMETGRREGVTPVKLICLPGELVDGAAEVRPPVNELRERYGPAVYQNGLMDVNRLPKQVLNDYRGRLGQYGFAGQVLQNPVPPGGGRFKVIWFAQIERAAPYACSRVRAWDRAATSEGGCASAGVLMAKDKEGKLYVEDCVHGHWEPNERNDIIVATAKRDRVKYGPKHDPTIIVEMERGSTGLESFQHLARRLMGFKIREVGTTTGGKDARAEPWADQLAAMNVWFVNVNNWDYDGFVNEHVLFRPDLTSKRLGGFKDRVDAASHASNWLASQTPSGTARVLAFRNPLERSTFKRYNNDGLYGTRCGRPIMRLVSSPPELLEGLVIEDHPCIIIRFSEPTKSGAAYISTETPAEPPHGIVKVLETLDLVCADVDPANLQDVWNEPLAPYGRKPEELILSRETCKKLWACLTRRRDVPWEAAIICGPGNIPLSVARGAAQGLGLREAESVYDVATGGSQDSVLLTGPAQNKFIFDLVKSTRCLVVT